MRPDGCINTYRQRLDKDLHCWYSISVGRVVGLAVIWDAREREVRRLVVAFEKVRRTRLPCPSPVLVTLYKMNIREDCGCG